MAGKKFLIVNADDFGLTAGVNAGIIRAHERGLVTSASLMVRGAAAADAAAYARTRTQLGVGLHVDLCEWRCVNDEWQLAYEVVSRQDERAVAAEVEKQIETFRQLMGRIPTHLDSHQHIHQDEPLKSILQAHAKKLGVVLRHTEARVNYCGAFYGQSDKGYAYHEGISVDALVNILRGLPPGVTELGCHPGLDKNLDSVYCVERAMECAVLCDARVRAAAAAAEIELRSFANAFNDSDLCP
jgi:chitin disaccharide deacetylase